MAGESICDPSSHNYFPPSIDWPYPLPHIWSSGRVSSTVIKYTLAHYSDPVSHLQGHEPHPDKHNGEIAAMSASFH